MLIIKEENKRRLFTAFFQVLKSCSIIINIHFKSDLMHIQGMDQSHICLYDIQIVKEWFDEYDFHEYMIHVDPTIMSNILSMNTHEIKIDVDDALYVDLFHPKYSKSFVIPLIDTDYSWMYITESDYDAVFSLQTKLMNEFCNQLSMFGNIMTFCCTEDNIKLQTDDGSNGEMKVVISIDDLSDYSIIEGETIQMHYSLQYINKFCLNAKIGDHVQFSISKSLPLKLTYNAGKGCDIRFYIAPKIDSDL